MHEQQLLDDYNFFRAYTTRVQAIRATRPLNNLGPSPKHIEPLKRMAAWCAEQGVNPRLWLYTLFLARRWYCAPPMGQLISKKHLAKYTEYTDTQFYEQRIRAESQEAEWARGDVFDPNEELGHASEEAKRYYLDQGTPQICLENMQAETYGYHPRSVVCARCLLSAQCKEQLVSSVDFDILALRRGELSRQDARLGAFHGAAHHGR